VRSFPAQQGDLHIDTPSKHRALHRGLIRPVSSFAQLMYYSLFVFHP
jgi:hypothetical protein